MADRCTVHSLPVASLADAAGDPALALMMRDGWEVVASVVLDEGQGPRLLLLLRPPRPTEAQGTPWWAWALGALLLLSTAASTAAAWL